MSIIQKSKLKKAITEATHWSKWLKEERNKADKKIFEQENFDSRMAIEAGLKSALTNIGIDTIDDIIKLLKEIENE